MNIRRELMNLIEDRTSTVDALTVARQLTEDAQRVAKDEPLLQGVGRVYGPEYFDRVYNMTVDQILQSTPHLGVFQVMKLRKEFGYDGDVGLGFLADVDALIPFAERIVAESNSRAPKVASEN